MNIYIGADYRGFSLKQDLLRFLADFDRADEVVDFGTYSASDKDDYNDPAIAVARAVRDNPTSRGILICDSAHGMTIQANRFSGIRATHCDSPESAVLAREHDDANILCLSAHFLDTEAARRIVSAFLGTDFQPLERRVRRINRLDEEVFDYDTLLTGGQIYD